MRQLDPYRVVDCNEDEKKGIGHEVLLTVVLKLLEILTGLLIDLNWVHMDWFVTHKCDCTANGYPAPVIKELDLKSAKVNFLDLTWKRVAPRADDFDDTKQKNQKN